jgi:translocation and assembly module TamB
MVRRRLVAELERVSGGRVELGGLHTIPFRLRVDVRDLTIHGREASGQVPLVHIDRLLARVKIISVLGAQFGFESVVLEHPVIHVITYADGTTNQPEPKVSSAAGEPAEERLFALRIARFELNQGQLLWNDQKIPLDLKAADIVADARFSLLHRRYNVNLNVGKVDTAYDGYRPVAWSGEAHFLVLAETVDVKSLKAASGRSRLEGSGQISNFRQPQFVGQYKVNLDLADVAAVARMRELRRGTLQMEGRGTWTAETFSSNGKVVVSDLEWRDKEVALKGAVANALFYLDSQKVIFSTLQANLFGGDIRGDAEVSNWLSSPSAAKRTKNQATQTATVRLKIKDVSVRDLTTAVASLRSLQEMKLGGLASGTVESRWRGSFKASESQIAIDVAPPSQLVPGQLPLRAQVRATYLQGPGELYVSEFNASTRTTQLRASGTLARHAALRLSLTSGDLAELDPLLADLGLQARNQVQMHGAASFTGTAAGRLPAIAFAGKLQAENFGVDMPHKAHSAGGRIRGDFLAADVQLSPERITAHHGTLRNGTAVVSFSGDAELDDWHFTADSPFSGHLTAQNVDLQDAMSITDMHYPVAAKLNFSLEADGTRSQPEGQGAIELSNVTVRGRFVRQVDSKFSLRGSQVALHDIRVAYQDAAVTGSGTYDFSSKVFHFDISGHNFDLAALPVMQSGPLLIQGRVDFDAQTSGTTQEPVIDAKIHLRDLVIGQEYVGEYFVDATTHGADLQLKGRSQFKQAELNIDGNVHVRDQWPANLDLHFAHLDVDPLLRIYLNKYVTGHSEAAGEVQVQGPLLRPRDLQVTSNITDFFADLEHVQIRNNGPIRFAFASQTIAVQQLRLVGADTDLSVTGTAGLIGDQPLSLHAQGSAGLALLHGIDPEFNSTGSLVVNVSLGGTIPHPTWQGSMQIDGGSIQYSDLPSALSQINGKLVFNQNRLEIETLTARVGGGAVIFGGYATAYRNQLSFDLTLTGHDVRLRYPQGVSSMTDAQLRWSGTPGASTISGDATLTKLAITPGFDFASYLTSSSQTVALPQTNPLLSRIGLDLHIVTTPELQMQTAAVRLSGNADFHLRGTAAKPVLLGRADVIEGEVYFNGAKYRLERGDISFTNPITTTPALDLQATTRVRDYDITLTLNGPIDKLKLNYRSEPPLSQADIISLLAVGQTQEQNAQLQQSGQSPYLQQASSAVLAEAINSALSNRSQRLFGISHIKVDPQGINSETTPVQPTPLPAVTIEQQVRDNITLSYTTNVAQTSQQIIQGEYNITRDIMVVGIRDYNGVVSFELRLRQRRR